MYFNQTDIRLFYQVVFQYIEVQQNEQVLTIRLNRPEKRNAFTPTMVAEIAFALDYAQIQKNIWCVILEAAGSVFCAGMDLSVFQNPALDIENPTLPKPIKDIPLGEVFVAFKKPCIAKVQGNVLAGGFLIICGCTVVVASDMAQFSLPEVKRGIFPMQVMASLLGIMPARKALEMCITAQIYSATQALQLGLVSSVVSPEKLDAETQQLVELIMEGSPFAIQKGMEACQQIHSVSQADLHTFLKRQLEIIRHSEDAQEGIAAFREKRKPIWQNQ